MSEKLCFVCGTENSSDACNCKICKSPLDILNRSAEERALLYKKGAEHGYANAQCNLGVLYRDGNGVLQDYTEAAKWFRKAAEQGHGFAQVNLGMLYGKGLGVPQDYAETEKWYRKAAALGNRAAQYAQYNLGVLYRDGNGVPQDYTEAVKWFRKSADGGDSWAQNALGVRYLHGEGVPKDSEEAVRWFRKAAEQNYVEAQFNLGVSYQTGCGIPKDDQKAREWYQKAADQGHVKAKSKLAELEDHVSAVQKPAAKNCTSPVSSNEAETQKESETLDSLLAELDSLVGLKSAKAEVQNRINHIRVVQSARQIGTNRTFTTGSLHLVFTGNPGTGKTTVARLIGKIYGKLGVLRNPDVFVECGRDDLVAGYIGQTASRVKAKFEEAKGGILFIDEAYSLYKEDDPKDFGTEAINTIVQYMESMRGDIMVIVAGYKNEMEEFIRDANPGLASRFRHTIHFDDYTQQELLQILESMICKEGMVLEEGAQEDLAQIIRRRSARPNFGNARGVRNLFEDLKEVHDAHLAEMISQGIALDAVTFDRITCEDVYRLPGILRSEELDIPSLLTELDKMVGLKTVKQQLHQQIAVVKTRLDAENAGVTALHGVGPQHMIFAGNPGTGKTTVARLVGRIYEALGLIADSSIFIECGRDDLVAGYIGQTAPKVKKKVEEALGGILFIDEAYSLYKSDSRDDFGREAVSELVKEMENHRDNLIVIMAGYSKDMREMIEYANAGLKSRFPIWLEFEDYSVLEMVQIFLGMMQAKGYHFDGDGRLLGNLIEKRAKASGFGNGRGVRNLVDEVITAQSMRLAANSFDRIIDTDEYAKIKDEDICLVSDRIISDEKAASRKIGF